MSSKHVISQFQKWFENRLSQEARHKIDRHLGECGKCRAWFAKMESLLDSPGKLIFPTLEADPFLATRVRTMAERTSVPAGSRHWLRWALAGAASSLAVLLGVELGQGLYSATQSNAAQGIVTTYYQAFSQQGIDDQWQDVLQINGSIDQ